MGYHSALTRTVVLSPPQRGWAWRTLCSVNKPDTEGQTPMSPLLWGPGGARFTETGRWQLGARLGDRRSSHKSSTWHKDILSERYLEDSRCGKGALTSLLAGKRR